MFSWQEQYFTRSLCSLVRYCSCHSNIKFISSRHRVISSVLQAIYDTTGERPTHRSYPCGTKLDSITHYERDLTVNFFVLYDLV